MNEIFYCVLKMSVDASYLICAVILVRFLLRNSSKLFRKLLWLLVGLRLLVPFSFESELSLVPQREGNVSDTVVLDSQVSAISATDAVNNSLTMEAVLPFIWALIVSGFVLFGLISFIKLKIKISDAVLLKGRVYQSEKVDSPFVCGFVKPKIYIPYKMDEDTLECVLKHENVHIKCFDHILKVVGFLILCVHWFNPLVWVSYILFCKDTELFCDELVVRNMSEESRRKYALALCDIGVEKVKISVCPVAFGEVGIKVRIKHAVNYKKARLVVVIISVAICVAVAVCFMTTPVKAKEENKKTEPEVVQTTEPVETTEAVVEIPETTEIVTEPVTEQLTEVVIENTTESYVEEYEVELPSIDDEEIERQRTLSYFKHQQELEEYARKQKEAQMQNDYNERNEASQGVVSSFGNYYGYSSPANSGPTGGSPMPSVPPLF